MMDGLSPETLAAQALGESDAASGALVPPIHPSTVYEANPDGTPHAGLAYTRADNPTYDHPERLLAALEGGAACMLFASGSAASTAVFQSLLPGDHVLVSRILYWGIRRWLAEFGISWGLDVEFVDTGDLDAVRRAMRAGRTRTSSSRTAPRAETATRRRPRPRCSRASRESRSRLTSSVTPCCRASRNSSTISPSRAAQDTPSSSSRRESSPPRSR